MSLSEPVAGVDEVGRGPWAGPLMACAVVWPWGFSLRGMDDSKLLTDRQRRTLFPVILQKALDIGLGSVEPALIDKKGIAWANLEAMRQALNNLKIRPHLVLVDYFKVPSVKVPQISIKGTASQPPCISAASIVAKVIRDNMMMEWDRIFPQYKFAKNKGYGTKEHLEALQKHGSCFLHRRSFSPVAAYGLKDMF